MGLASARKRDKISVKSAGKKSPTSIDNNCPTFMAAPRKLANSSATRLALAGVNNKLLTLGRCPCAICRAPSASILPATPVANEPKRARRAKRPVGTVVLCCSSALFIASSHTKGIKGELAKYC